MSVQFGRWNFDGQPADREFLRRAADLTTKYAPDGQTFMVHGSLAFFFQVFQTTKESEHERQPVGNSAGVVLTWDGRLDNRDELAGLLRLPPASHHFDAEIVLAAYERWDTACFSRLIGDWALAVWDPRQQVLLLAKDFVGTRHLFYQLETNLVTWSTVLDPLVLLSPGCLQISEEFVAGYLSTFPATHLTPYTGIKAVPASTFVRIARGQASAQQHWCFDPCHCIRHRTDTEYEEHFRSLLCNAVRRRLRSSFPVLAELSGGIDSTAIVCVADQLLARGQAAAPRIDTISYYNDHEPNWNERPYFSLVESKRGREGYHINVAITEGAFLPPEDHSFPLPGYDQLSRSREREFHGCLETSQCRVVLSGIGGDEFLGGVPTPAPELQDLFVRLRWLSLGRQICKWSLQQRRPALHLLWEIFDAFLPRVLSRHPRIPPWLGRAFVEHNKNTFWGHAHRTKLTGSLPSFQSNVHTLDHLRRQIGLRHPSPAANHRVSYPYLDRDLLAFLFAIPREQLIRPGQRRFLMRRSLKGLVPAEILARKRKAYVARQPLLMLADALAPIERLLESPLIARCNWVDLAALRQTLQASQHGRPQDLIPMMNTLKLELWLREFAANHAFAQSVRERHDELQSSLAGRGTRRKVFNPRGLNFR